MTLVTIYWYPMSQGHELQFNDPWNVQVPTQILQRVGWIQKDYFWTLHPQVEIEQIYWLYHTGNEEKLATAGFLKSSIIDIWS